MSNEVEQRMVLLQNILLLQHEAGRGLLREYHQHIEAFIKLTGEHPITNERMLPAHDETVLPQARVPNHSPVEMLSDLIMELSQTSCDANGCVKESEMVQFMTRVASDVKALDDKYVILHALDITFNHVPADRNNSTIASQNTFAASGGYATLIAWLQQSCKSKDDHNRQFTLFLLDFLQRYKPQTNRFSQNLVRRVLQELQTTPSSRLIKAKVKDTLEKYREG